MKRLIVSTLVLGLALGGMAPTAFAAETMKVKVNKPAIVGTFEEQKGSMIEVYENEKDSWNEEQIFEFKLTSGIKWNKKTLVNGKEGQIDGSSLKYTMKTSKDAKEMLYVIPYFDIERGTAEGDLTVLVNVVGKDDDEVVKVAKISDYAVNISSSFERVSKNNKIPVEITVSEAVENSMINGAIYDLVFDNAQIVKDTVKVKNVKGEDTLNIKDQQGDYVTFDLADKSSSLNKWTINLDIVPNDGYVGDVTAKFEGKGVDAVETVVGKVVEGLKLDERKPNMVVLGKQDQVLSNIVLEEQQAGALQKGDYMLKLNPAYKGLKFDGFKFNAIEGDIRVGNEKIDGSNVAFTVRGESTKPSKIEISDMKVSLDRFGYDGSYKFDLVNSKDPEKALQTVELFVVNPETEKEETKDNGVVFSIDSKEYTVDGKVKSMDTAPYISNGRTMLPVRVLAESLDTEVNWDKTTRTATLKTKEGNMVVITLDKEAMLVDGKSVQLDAPAEVKNDRTFLPMRAIAESLGADVQWDAATRTAIVVK